VKRTILLAGCLCLVVLMMAGCKACRPTPAAPTPLAPANGSELGTLQPSLLVQDMREKGVDQYRWTLKDEAGNVITQGVSVEPSWTLSKGTVDNNTTYAWTCAAHNSKGWGKDFKPDWKFTTNLLPPGATEAVSPLDGAEISSLNPMLEVRSIPEVDDYTWSVKDTTGKEVAASTTNDPMWTVTSGLADKMKYTWSAKARNAAGEGPMFAPERWFRVKLPPPPKPPAPPLQVIYFDFDKYTIRPGDAKTLEGNAEYLRQNIGLNLTLEGYCDPVGTEEYNRGLGLRRANSTRAYLVKLGIDPARLGVISFGEDNLVTQDEAQFEMNRRVEFKGK
jgi:outer membrane protein OmpA-like peptidoglycan-associated protein